MACVTYVSTNHLYACYSKYYLNLYIKLILPFYLCVSNQYASSQLLSILSLHVASIIAIDSFPPKRIYEGNFFPPTCTHTVHMCIINCSYIPLYTIILFSFKKLSFRVIPTTLSVCCFLPLNVANVCEVFNLQVVFLFYSADAT